MNIINIKDLKKIVNPFKDDIFSLGKPIIEKDIKEKIENLNFLIQDSDTDYIKTVKKIAFAVKNFTSLHNSSVESVPVDSASVNNSIEDNNVKKERFLNNDEEVVTLGINVGFPENAEEVKDIIYFGKIEYAAALYRKEEKIQATINGSSKYSKSVFGCDADTSEVNFMYTSNQNIIALETINFNTMPNKDLPSSINSDLILKKIKNDNNVEQTLKTIDKSLYEDDKFIYNLTKLLLEEEYLQYSAVDKIDKLIPKKLYLNKQMIDKLAQEPQSFMQMWIHVYEPMFRVSEVAALPNIQQERIEDIYDNDYKYDDDKFLYYSEDKSIAMSLEYLSDLVEANLQEKKHKKPTSKEKQQQKEYEENLKEEKELVSYIKEYYFSKLDWLETIGQTNNIHRIYNYLPDNLKNSSEILKKVINEHNNKSYSYRSSTNFYKSLPHTFFAEPENAAFLFNKNPNDYYFNKDHIKLVTKNKSYILKLLQLSDKDTKVNSLLDDVYAWDNNKLSSDKDILKAFIQLNVNNYQKMKPTDKKDIELITLYLENDGKLTNIQTNLWKNITDEKLIQKALQRAPGALLDESCPAAWRYNKEYLKLLGEKIKHLEYNSVQWQKTLGSDINNYKEFITLYYAVYNDFPKKIKQDVDLTTFALNIYKDDYNKRIHLNIDNGLFGSRNFCLYALTISETFFEQVPEFFFTDKKFIIKLLEQVDNRKTKKIVLSKMPELNDLFIKHEIKENFSINFKTFLLEQSLNNKQEEVPVRKRKL